jgi:hypothetical protein
MYTGTVMTMDGWKFDSGRGLILVEGKLRFFDRVVREWSW